MGRKTVLVDDFDGSELPDDTAPVTLSLGGTTYSLYLSEDNYAKLVAALEPFVGNADRATPSRRTIGNMRRHTAPSTAARSDRDRMREVRAWAQSSGFTYTDSHGTEKTVGDRGRIPDEVVRAYDEAH